MRGGHADHIDKQWHCQNRTAAADQPEDKTDHAARNDRQQVVKDRHYAVAGVRRFQGISTKRCAMPQKPVVPAKTKPAPTKPDNA